MLIGVYLLSGTEIAIYKQVKIMKMKRVLVVDHIDRFRNALITILHIEGYHAIGVGCTSDAKGLLKTREFSIVFMELDSTYYENESELLVWLKRYKPSLPVIIMSDMHGRKYQNKLITEIADDYILKPMQIEDIKRLIQCVREYEG